MRETGSESWADQTTPTAHSGLTERAPYLAALDWALFDANPDLVWEFDPDGFVRRANARLADVLGYTPDAVRGRRLHELEISGDDSSDRPFAAAFVGALAGRASACVCSVRHRDGRKVVLRASVIPLVLDGAAVSVFVTAQDVTASYAAEQQLREAEALYRLLVEQSPECVAIHVDDRYVYVNVAGARILLGAKHTPHEVVGHNWREFIAADDQAEIARACLAVSEAPEGGSRPFEARIVHPDGRVLEIEGVITHVRYHGRPAIHSFSRDVTARRRVESERLGAQRLEALGRLAAGVAHDFNNLLAVMLLAVESAVTALPTDDPLRDDLADAADAARRGRALTRQLLTFARRQESSPRTFALNDVVQSMRDLLQRIAGPRVRLTFALALDSSTITADPAQVEQVLLNLVTNARDALPTGGAVTIETARSDDEVRLTVRDTGVGIAPEVRPHLFEPFFTTKREGYGLGLATVYGVVTGAGGHVDVESAPGQGTAFHLYFPIAEGRTGGQAISAPR